MRNLFSEIGDDPDYDVDEIQELINRCDECTSSKDEVKLYQESVKKLLAATATFYNQTAQQPQHVHFRNVMKDEERTKRVDQIAQVIESKFQELQNQDSSSENYLILESALKYCSQSLSNRINQIKKQKEALYNNVVQKPKLNEILKKYVRSYGIN